jgi:hypothetical protein
MQDNEPLMRALAKVSLCFSRSSHLPTSLYHVPTYPDPHSRRSLSGTRSSLPLSHPHFHHPFSRITLDLRSRDTITNIQLVTVNNPDKILFVGEALVGNEAVDQLTKFDRALKDFSSAGIGGGSRKRGIDGIILTKFDTIVSHLSSYRPFWKTLREIRGMGMKNRGEGQKKKTREGERERERKEGADA